MTNTEIYNLRKDYQTFALDVQNTFFASPNNIKNRIRYTIIGKIYKELLTKNNEKDIREYANSLVSIVTNYENEYSKLYKEYKEGKVTKHTLNEYAYKINAYNESINLIAKHLVTKKIKPIKKEEVKPREEIQPKEEVKLNTEIEETEEILYSDKIVDLIRQYNKLDKNSSDAINILKQVYFLREQRKNNYINLIGNTAISLLSEIDSIEMMMASSDDKKNEPYEVTGKGYVKLLKDTLEAINEYHFTDYLLFPKNYQNDNSLSDSINQKRFDKKYSEFLKSYKNIISSLFETETFEFNVDGISLNTNDLISYLSLYNLNEGYNVFKGKNSKISIGTKKLDKKEYEREVEFLKKCINELCNIALKKIGDKKITICDSSIGIKELKESRNIKFNNIKYLMNRGSGYGKK